jgi:hypothetical protein
MQLVFVARQYLFNCQRPRPPFYQRDEPIMLCSFTSRTSGTNILSYKLLINCLFLSFDVGAVGVGGAGRDRTGDLLNANQALSQLSYSPV